MAGFHKVHCRECGMGYGASEAEDVLIVCRNCIPPALERGFSPPEEPVALRVSTVQADTDWRMGMCSICRTRVGHLRIPQSVPDPLILCSDECRRKYVDAAHADPRGTRRTNK